MARADTETLLSLDRYARIMGIGGPYFNQGCVSDSGTPWHVSGRCTDIWFQYAWQNSDAVSREDLAFEIGRAEEEIADVIGYPVAPTYVVEDVQPYPRPYGRDMYRYGGRNVRGMGVSIQARWGKIVSPGQRQADLILGAVVPVYTDTDGDGFWETATVTVPGLTAVEQSFDTCSYKAYFVGQDGLPEWEIRPAKSKTITGGSLVLVYDSWLFIDPDLWEAPPMVSGVACVDISGSPAIHGNYVRTVDVYREYCDPTDTSASFYWEPLPSMGVALASAGYCCCGMDTCPACTLTEQPGCFHIRDYEIGVVVPIAAEYSASVAAWNSVTLTACRDPDMVKLSYLAGDQDQRFMKGQRCDPLSDKWAQAIAYMATARVERPICSCGNVDALAAWTRYDLAAVSSQERQSQSYQMSMSDLDNPFGTRQGEMFAWRLVKKFARNAQIGSAVI